MNFSRSKGQSGTKTRAEDGNGLAIFDADAAQKSMLMQMYGSMNC